MPYLMRLTLFKIPSEEGIKEAIKVYSTLAQDAKKDGESYILSASANATYKDERNLGYTFAAYTVFENKEHMDYYDAQCEAHANIKGTLRKYVEGGPPLVVYMDADLKV